MKLSIIIPAYNEEKIIKKSISTIKEYIKKNKFNAEIIVVNDGSKDNTKRELKKCKGIRTVSYNKNKGKGYAVKKGMLSAKGDILLFLDADLATPIQEIKKFLDIIKKYDVLIGSRVIKGANVRVHQPFYRELLGKCFNKFVQLFAVWGIWDTQCGFKMFNKKAAKIIFPRQRILGWAFDVELLYLAKKHGLKIKEVPVTWINEPDTRLSPIASSIEMFLEIIKIRINNVRGYYK